MISPVQSEFSGKIEQLCLAELVLDRCAKRLIRMVRAAPKNIQLRVGAPRNAIASDEGKVHEPGWHLCPCGHSNIAIGGDFKEVAIFSEQTAANAGQGASRISRKDGPMRLRFEPAHLRRDTSDDQNQYDHGDGGNRKRQSSPDQPATRIFLARIHDVHHEPVPESVRPVVYENAGDRHPDDANVEGDGPMADIVKVVRDPHLHLIDEVGFPSPPIDLRPTRDAGLDLVAQKVSVDQFAVLLVVLESMGPRSDQRHASRYHVHQLRDLVEARTAQERAQLGDPGIAAPCLAHTAFRLVVYAHRSELPDFDGLAVQPTTSLAKQYGPPAGYQNRHGDDQHERDRQDQK